jgi:hypothetical protein
VEGAYYKDSSTRRGRKVQKRVLNRAFYTGPKFIIAISYRLQISVKLTVLSPCRKISNSDGNSTRYMLRFTRPGSMVVLGQSASD